MTTNPPLVGLLGKKRAGKDTFARHLIETHGFTRYAFADPLKAAALDAAQALRVPISVDELHYFPGLVMYGRDETHLSLRYIVNTIGWEKAKGLRAVRAYLQDLGLSMRENVDETVWVRATLDQALASGSPVVITDVRFPNEADAIEAAGGILVRITRPGLVSDDPHPSETALDDYIEDLQVSNGGTPEDLAEPASVAVSLAFARSTR